MRRYLTKSYDYITNVIKDYALEKFVKSNYLKSTTSIIPLTLLTMVTRAIFNFLITSRITTENVILNFFLYLIVTVILTLLSPAIYSGLSKTYEKEIEYFSETIIFSFWEEGWFFVNKWKNRILGFLGILIIIILFFIEINSRMIQEFLVHTMITTLLVDYLNNISELNTDVKINAREIFTISVNSPLIVISNKDKHVIYKVNSKVKRDDQLEHWTSFHRYSDFENLDNKLRKANFLLPEFPSKSWVPVGQFDREWIESRCKKLNLYMNVILKNDKIINSKYYFNIIVNFLYSGENIS